MACLSYLVNKQTKKTKQVRNKPVLTPSAPGERPSLSLCNFTGLLRVLFLFHILIILQAVRVYVQGKL